MKVLAAAAAAAFTAAALVALWLAADEDPLWEEERASDGL